jgi:hypothetical protein
MADRQKCLDNARKIDPNAKLCEESACKEFGDMIYRFCNCLPPYPPQKPCPYGPNTPIAVYEPTGSVCYCCCSGVNLHTPVAVPEGEARPIQTLEVGDEVLAAGTDLDWTRYKVEFSGGIPPGPEGETMLSVYYQLPEGVGALVVKTDHVFRLADGNLKRAEFIVPGKDRLSSADGEAVPVLSVEAGDWHGGVRHIATTDGPATSVDGHLLNAQGIVTGDWALQIADLEGGLVAGAEVEMGPAAAAELAHALEGVGFRHSAQDAEWEHARHRLFKPYGPSNGS